MENRDSVLIASSSIDEPNFRNVAESLSKRGFEPLVYEADRVANGNVRLAVSLSEDGTVNVNYNSCSFGRDNIAAAWYRKPDCFDYKDSDKATLLCKEREARSLQAAVWSVIPEERWLNPPAQMEVLQEKIGQLALARAFGFSIPETMISNDWDSIKGVTDSSLIMKMQYGLLYRNNEAESLYTTILSHEKIEGLAKSVVPFPGIFQPYIKKAKEWRLTVVGEEAFAAAIYTDENAKDDWRKHQLGPGVRFSRESIRDDIKEQCINFIGHLGLKFGAFDFIEDEDGNMTYLEMNPNGQFMWLEQRLGLPISSAITDELIKIASSEA